MNTIASKILTFKVIANPGWCHDICSIHELMFYLPDYVDQNYISIAKKLLNEQLSKYRKIKNTQGYAADLSLMDGFSGLEYLSNANKEGSKHIYPLTFLFYTDTIV